MSTAASAIRAWREDPVLFVRQVLNAEPDEWQADALRSLLTFFRLALKASKGPGKSTLLAWICWWFLMTRRHPKIAATSITADNLKDNLWTELSKWQQKSPLLSKTFTWTKTRIESKDHPETWWASARTWNKDADALKQGETLAGLHADNIMFLCDESGGYPDAVMAAAEGGLANASKEAGREAYLIQAGNPTQLSGPLYRACEKERHLWKVIEISGDPDDPKRAPRVSLQWAREQIEKYGRDHPWVLVNVFGKFPPAQSNSLIGRDLVVAASKRSLEAGAFVHEAKVLGIDVARTGDDRSAFVGRQGRVAFKPKVFRIRNLMELADQAAFTIDRWKPDGVFVDETGMGAGVVDRLQQLGYEVQGINFGSASVEGRCVNRRTEMWVRMGDWVRTGGCIADDQELVDELSAPTFRFNARGQYVLESKEDMKARGIQSPDLGDGLALTFASPVLAKKVSLPSQLRRQEPTDYDPFKSPANDYDPMQQGAF